MSKIKEIILTYTSSIVELIDGNVYWYQIDEKLPGFIRWLETQLGDEETGNDLDIFTLNFDLLLETMLLELVGRNRLTDFHVKRGKWNGNDKFNFDPQQNLVDLGNRRIRLHHLHGSLSSFKRLSDGRIFKQRTEDIRLTNMYKNMDSKRIFPAIITGGFKSRKVQTLPFSYYYAKFKEKMIDPNNLCEELYIIGYSFRDEHINDAIIERLKLTRSERNHRKLNIKIVDFKSSEEQDEFVQGVNDALKLKSKQSRLKKEENFIFGGANSIENLL